MLYEMVIRTAQPDLKFNFEIATHVGAFIALASKPETHLALFMPPGNLIADPGDAEATPEQMAIRIVRAIKVRRSIPFIVSRSNTTRGRPCSLPRRMRFSTSLPSPRKSRMRLPGAWGLSRGI